MNIKNLLAATGAAFLVACGGSDGAPPVGTISVSGTVATGAPMAGASVTLQCNSGRRSHTATAGADGKYAMSLPSDCEAPYALKAELNGKVLYAFSDAAGTINITPLTDIAAYIAAKGITAEEYLAIAEGLKQVSALWTAARQDEINLEMMTRLAASGLPLAGLDDLLHPPFDATAGNKLDDLLELLKVRLGSVPYSSLGAQVVNAGGSPMDKPWLALFKPGTPSRTIVAAGCAFDDGGGPVGTGPATVTFTPSGDKLLVSVAAEGAPQAPVLEIGGEGTRFGIFYPGGTGPGRNIGIMAGSGMLALTTLDPAAGGPFSLPALAFGTPSGGSLYCATLTTGIAAESLHAFDIPARVSSILGTTTSVASPAQGCAIPNTDPPQTYTYAVSAFGELTLNGQPFTSSQLAQANPYLGYVDGFDWPADGQRKAMAALSLVIMPMVQLERTASGLSHTCDMQPI